MKGNKLRWADIADAHEIAKLELKSAVFEKRVYPIDIPVNDFTKIWQERLKSGEYKTIVCEYKGKIAGFLSFEHAIKKGDVCCLYIHPKYFRQGIGKKLMRAAAFLVRLEKGKALTVDVEMFNFGAQIFYQSLHFKSQSVKLKHLIVMVKELSSC